MDKPGNGYMGKILRVDLSTGKTGIEPLPEEMIKLYIGGRGIGAKLLFDEVKAGVDPLSPANKLIFTNGPLTDTLALSCSRWIVTTKSPLTGTIFRACAGGSFGAELKSAGFDVLIVEGKADRPVYLWIKNDQMEIRDAGKLLGLLSNETASAIRRELQDEKIKVAAVGPSAEKRILFAAIVDDRRTASRGGVGTVMWSKNLKAIAVKGSKQVEVADWARLQELAKIQVETVKNDPNCQGFSQLGSAAAGVSVVHALGLYPVRNFQYGVLEGVENLAAEKIKAIIVKDVYCHKCNIHCGKIVKIKSGPYTGNEVEGPEYETMYSFGGMVGNANLGMIVEANRICDDYGVDTISAGNCIGFAMELYEREILTRRDLDDLDLTWGNHEAIITLLKKIVTREGIGDLLAEGTRQAAQKIGKGADKYAMQVKGLELPGYDPRGIKALALNFATANLGGAHTVGMSAEEIMGDRFTQKGKGRLCKEAQDIIGVYDSGINCIFPVQFQILGIANLQQLLPAATGIAEFSDEGYLLKAGERIWNVEHAFNVRDGFSRKDDVLPPRFLSESVENGPTKGQIVELDQMLDDYYEARGWDKETGNPKRPKLESLDLKSVADELEKIGQLTLTQPG